MAARSNHPALSTVAFEIHKQSHPTSHARTGFFKLHRDNGDVISIHTPGLMAPSSRGVIPHLSQDQLARVPNLQWVHLPFES